MNELRFDPLNDLETALLALRDRTLAVDAFMETLLKAQVFILLDRDPGPEDARDHSAAPLLLNNPAGLPVLAVFTAAERALSMSMAFPAYQHGLWTEFRWLLSLVRPGIGLVLNPGTLAGFEMPAEGVARLQAQHPRSGE